MFLPIALLLACSGGPDDSTAPPTETELVFDQETTLRPAKKSCNHPPDYSFGATNTRHAAVALEPPDPPYEVRSVSAMLGLAGSAILQCDETQMALLMFTIDPSTDATDFNGGATPSWTPIQSAIVGGPAALAPDGTVTWTLDEPYLVEDSGTLWIGYEPIESGSGDSYPCLAVCDGGQGGSWLWRDSGGEFVPVLGINDEPAFFEVSAVVAHPTRD